MHTILSLFLTSLLVTIAQSTTPTLAGDLDIIERDVAIIGGGAGGTYCAISLQDQGKSVIVIEKEHRLGGHVETYVDPGTGIAMDYGVALFENTSVKLLIAIPPNPSLLYPWLRLTPTKHSLFTRYISTGLYVGLVNGTRLPPTAGILNLAPNHTMYSFPYLPDTYSLIPARLPGLKLATYGSLQTTDPFPISEAAVRHHMLDDIRRIHRENPDRFPGTSEPAFVAFAAHAPYNLQVSGEDIKNGFYEGLYALQGEMNTFWTGSAWAADISGDIWKVSRGVVLPMLVGEL
ncbi:NAD(P)-binding protein [Aspergillus fijiensis CBS 313.89]|uniref:FAD/NAD(P)-binding domain-containing protein n=1 Tax=Aspergillus fijiensis CBS 313.89 TaxID=1448319 RepID=A0A8G1S0J1_9EURO|nr:uncharacterized protein BO72DRAFT_524002 [Aspergillus fijiensis CBS 313.89]RAK82167.1 hypothetical protein BO72DRAFT_524002 [Aspergillus fijiensis CBS 313.89]